MRILSQFRVNSRQTLSFCAAIIVLIPPAFAQQSVTAVRFWSLGDVTRVAVEATGDFEFRKDRLANPDRVFFDLPGTVPALDRKGVNVIAVDDGFVKQIRVAETQRGTTRVVLDLQVPGIEVSTSKLENPDRLIIELRKPGTHPAEPAVPALVTSVTSKPEEPARVFHAPPPTFAPVIEKRKAQTPQLDPPSTVVGGHFAATALKNDPLSRMPAASVPPPPAAPETVAMRMKPAPIVTREQPAERIGMPAERIGAKSRATREETMTRALGLKVGRIVIDAGHGGHDVGSTGASGLREKDLVLDVAMRLGSLVEQQLGWEVIYTRTDDTFIPLEQRTEIANTHHADLFLSIHANSSGLRSATGIETYYLNFTTSKSALDVAARENATSEKTVYDLQDLLQKIALKDKVDESREFAARIQSSLYGMSAKAPARTRDRGVRKAPFVVLIGASMPSILAEIGFISNPRDEAQMKKPEYREKIAEALYKGVAGYAGTLSHFQVAQSHVN